MTLYLQGFVHANLRESISNDELLSMFSDQKPVHLMDEDAARSMKELFEKRFTKSVFYFDVLSPVGGMYYVWTNSVVKT